MAKPANVRQSSEPRTAPAPDLPPPPAPDLPSPAPPNVAFETPTNLDGPAAILAAGLVKSYGGRRVVNEVSFEVARGEVVGLLGPNGAGKTTSFYMVMGLVQPDDGSIKLGDQSISRWPMHQRARAGIGYLAQDASVFRKLSVEDNLRAILQLMPLSKAQRKARLEELLHDLGLEDRRHTPGIKLSGGERRRTEIARTLATDPYFILLDEPFTGVDPIVRHEIQDIVLRLKKRGIGVLITDHNEHDTLEIIDRGYILFDGKIMTQGSSNDLLTDPRARELYFGEKIRRVSRRDENN